MTTRIETKLLELIATHRDSTERKLVFWFDPEAEFGEAFEALNIEEFKKITLTDHNQIKIKFYLELEGLDVNAIIYCPYPEKPAKEEPLYDLLCQGQKFAADRISLLMTDLELSDQSCRDVLTNSYFKNKDRVEKLRPLLYSNMTGRALQKAMLFSLTGVNDLSAFKDVLIRLLEEGLDRGVLSEEWEKFTLEEVFWDEVRQEYGYQKSASIRELAVHLCLSAWYAEGHGIPENRKPCVMDRPKQALLLINYWKQQTPKTYHEFTKMMGEHLQITEDLGEIKQEYWVHSTVFPVFEKACLNKAVGYLLKGETQTARKWLEYHPLTETATAQIIRPACTFFEAKAAFIEDTQADQIYKAYAERHYKVDQAYRQFYTHWDEHQEWGEAEHRLREKVENDYINQYLHECSLRWETYLENSQIWDQWPGKLPMEYQHFFAQKLVVAERKNRTYVIISDALRYEVGKELAEELTKENLGEASCEPMVAVIPTYTQLGMAALLPMKNPNESLAYAGRDIVTVDGKSSQGIANRAKIIQAAWPDGTAIKYKDFMSMPSNQGRAWQKDYKTIYIYHDAIDAVGDNAKTEEKTFKAAKEAIEELKSLVQRITSMNAYTVLITADHGFLYQRTKLEEIDKVKVEPPDQKLLGKNRRFYLASDLQASERCNLVDMGYLLGKDTKLKALLASGNQRISRQGAGANFVHGGASLQEIMIPLIRYKHKRAGTIGSERARMVNVAILFNGTIKSNNISITLQQEEPLGEKRTKRPLQVGVYDQVTGTLLSSVGTVVFDSIEQDRANRIQVVKLSSVKELADRKKAELRLQSPEGEIYKREPCLVRIYFKDDFGV